MPTFRSINIALHSQFDVVTLPEYDSAQLEPYVQPVDDASSTCTVVIPILAGSIFWISYSITPPVPEGHLYLFKLYINGAHIVNWSVGKEEAWRGKTMFGLYKRPEDEEGKKKVEKRALCFMPPDKSGRMQDSTEELRDHKMCMEIKVHRAHGRKRVERHLEEYSRTEYAQDERGFRLVSAGCASSEEPKRFYKFALIDPVDQPFATFRYLYRTWDQLRHLGLLNDDQQGAGEENDLSVIEPDEDSDAVGKASGRAWDPNRDTEDMMLGSGNGAVDRPVYDAQRADEKHKDWRSSNHAPCQTDYSSCTAYRPRPACPVDECRVRGPSSVKSTRNNGNSPPLLEKRRGQGMWASSLINVLSSAWKRRGAPSASAEGHGGESARSVS